MKVCSVSTILTTSITILLIGFGDNNNNVYHNKNAGSHVGLATVNANMLFIGTVCGLFNPFSAFGFLLCVFGINPNDIGRRRLVNDDDETDGNSSGSGIWIDTKEACGDVNYEMNLMVHTDTGHLLFLASPSSSDGEEEEQEELCKNQWIIHTAYATEDDEDHQVPTLFTHHAPENWNPTNDETIALYDMNVALTFDEIAVGVDTIQYDPTTTYSDKKLPMNCATYLIELAKYWNIPIDEELVSFVIVNVQDSAFMGNFIQTNRHLLDQDWFGSTPSNGDMEDSFMVLHRLADYMLKEQYPLRL